MHYQLVTSCRKNAKSHWLIVLHEISKWFMSIYICIPCNVSDASTAVFREGHQRWGLKIIGIYRVPLPLHRPVFLSMFPPLTLSVFQLFDGKLTDDNLISIQAWFPCYLGAKPCNSYKCHIKSQPGRWEWQSDREAIHNCYYLCLCGWHPQIELCSCSVPVLKRRRV